MRDKMPTTAVVLACGVEERAACLRRTLPMLDKFLGKLFSEKHLCIDIYNDVIGEEDIAQYRQAGWTVHKNQFYKFPKNLGFGLRQVKTEWAFFGTDDLLMKESPTLDELVKLSRVTVDGRKVGIISYRCTGFDWNRGDNIRLAQDQTKYRVLSNGLCVWQLNEATFTAAGGWVEFGCSFLRAEIPRSIWASAEGYTSFISDCFSKAFFKHELQKQYAKLCILRDVTNRLEGLNTKTFSNIYHHESNLIGHLGKAMTRHASRCLVWK